MNKTISTTIGTLIVLLVAGIAGASVLFFNQEIEEELALEEDSGLEADKETEEDASEQEDKIWIEISPIQCMLNPWQAEYIEKGSYPREWEEEKKIIKGYYERLGVSVFDIFSEVFADAIPCEACSCSDGTKLYLLIDSSDLKRMSDDGFNRTEKDMMTCTEKCESLGYTEGSCLSFGTHPAGFEGEAEIMKTFDKLGETRDCFLPQNRYRPDGIDKNCYCFPKK